MFGIADGALFKVNPASWRDMWLVMPATPGVDVLLSLVQTAAELEAQPVCSP